MFRPDWGLIFFINFLLQIFARRCRLNKLQSSKIFVTRQLYIRESCGAAKYYKNNFLNILPDNNENQYMLYNNMAIDYFAFAYLKLIFKHKRLILKSDIRD